MVSQPEQQEADQEDIEDIIRESKDDHANTKIEEE